jgi:hypothetical protein
MSIQTYYGQTMLVSIAFGCGHIIATDSDIIKHEVKEGSAHVEDHFYTLPETPGLYVWAGDITVSVITSASSPVDGETKWTGEFRYATLADIFRFEMLHVRLEKAPDAVPTAEVPVLRLKCYHLSVMNMGVSPYDAVNNHSGHYNFELVDPVEGTSALVQEWLNDETADGGPTLRHLEIEDRSGVRRFVAQRRGNSSMFFEGCIKFDAYTDYAGVRPNPGVTEMMMENPCLKIDFGYRAPAGEKA